MLNFTEDTTEWKTQKSMTFLHDIHPIQIFLRAVKCFHHVCTMAERGHDINVRRFYLKNLRASYFFQNLHASYFFQNLRASYFFQNLHASYFFQNLHVSYFFQKFTRVVIFFQNLHSSYVFLWR